MLSTKVLSTIVLFLGLAVAAPAGLEQSSGLEERQQGNGDRVCILGGISCEYESGTRCAKVCQSGAICSCPDGHWDNNIYYDTYQGASCIPVWTALGRHLC